jgi:hypothetical protein
MDTQTIRNLKNAIADAVIDLNHKNAEWVADFVKTTFEYANGNVSETIGLSIPVIKALRKITMYSEYEIQNGSPVVRISLREAKDWYDTFSHLFKEDIAEKRQTQDLDSE